MIETGKAIDYKNLHTRLEEIISSLSDAHNLLAKSAVPSETYNPTSLLLAKSKLDLFEVHNGIIYMQDCIDMDQEMYNEAQAEIEKYKSLYELTETQRKEWADSCIRLRIELDAQRTEPRTERRNEDAK